MYCKALVSRAFLLLEFIDRERIADLMLENQLADALGMVKQTIQKYESGEVKMPPEIIYRCAKVFQVPIGYFYGEGTAKKYSKASLLIAAEAMLLPNDEMRQRVYALLKSINYVDEQDN